MNKNFIIVGAQRSGTTYLYNILDEHPEVCMAKPIKPEPKYFLDKSFHELNQEDYQKSFFSNCASLTTVFGEKSTSYYEKEESAKLISSLLPNAKIFFLLRNPVDRALSNYFFSVNNGLETRSLEDVFLHNKPVPSFSENISVNPFNYRERGEYIKFISVYKQYFSSEQIQVLIFEELVGNLSVVQNIYSFLNIDNTFIPSCIKTQVNASEKNSNVSIEVIEHLKSYYQNSINSLEQYLDRKISVWK